MGVGNDQVKEVAGYRLIERIGVGGMGEVYKAYNDQLHRFAAVKILDQAALADRFKNEAYIQASVSHRNIARLYEFTQCRDKHCIVMEYVEGETLDTLRHSKGKLSSGETEDILRQIVSALVYLHKKDILHRDIKPQNFKVQPDGMVKMLDFGIARHKLSPKFTQLGYIVGTSDYLSPEQFNQQPELKSDVWALAVMCYELITGYLPFEGPNPIMLQASIRKGAYTNPALLIPHVSEKLLLIIEKGLKVNPASRISAAGIESILGKTSGEPNSAGPSPLAIKKIGWGMVAGLAVLLVLFFLISSNDQLPAGDEKTVDADKVVLKQANAAAQQQINRVSTSAADSKIIINVPGVSNAELILKDGSHQPLPFTVIGKEGDQHEFTLHADGYKDKSIQVVLTPRRISYEFNLEKNN